MASERARVILAALVAAICLPLGACADPAGSDGSDGSAGEAEFSSDARALTTEEAQLLATARFRNFDAGTRSVAASVTDNGSEAAVAGWFDYETGTGYAATTVDGEPGGLLLWNEELLGAHAADGSDADTGAPLPIPDVDALATAWTGRALDASSSRVDAVLSAIGALGADRPENPLLLQQGGALWLGESEQDGVPVTVFAGPASDAALEPGATASPDDATVRYWIDEDGLMVRVDLRLGGESTWTTVSFGDADGVSLGDPFAVTEQTG